MRVGTLIGVGLALGLILGVGQAYWQFGPHSSSTALGSGRSRQNLAAGIAASPSGAVPVAVIDKDLFEFGKMEADAKASHDFIIKNEGNAPLQLQKGDTTCKCTLSELAQNEVPPGESATITLTWEAKGGPGPFRQSAAIHTNDPQRRQLSLAVSGEITQSVEVSPADLVFPSLPTNESRTGQVKIYAYHADNLQVLSHRFDNLAVADKFEVLAEPLPADELAKKLAKSGLQITVTVKPGLPLGPVRQRIVLATNLEKASKLEIPIEGHVTSDISIVGNDWAANLGQLRLGKLSTQEETSRTLRLVIRGPHRKETEFKIAKVWPEQLRAVLGEKTETSNGAVTLVPLTISVPKGTPPMNHWGTDQGKFGEVLLETSHPEVKEVKLLVQFAVGE